MKEGFCRECGRYQWLFEPRDICERCAEPVNKKLKRELNGK